MPTTNAVPSADPSDLLFNAQKLDEVVNGSAESFFDRRGVERLTLTGALRLIGFEAPVAFTTGLSITRSTQTVTNDGNTYHAYPASLPFTTTGTFNGAQWRLVSNVTSFDLAAYAVPLVGGAGTVEMAKLTAPVQALINGALQRSGGTMTGAIVLPGNATNALEAVPKQQAESIAAQALSDAEDYTDAAQTATEAKLLGVSQSWQAVIRAGGTTYFNTTGRPIQLLLNGVTSGANVVGIFYVAIDGGANLPIGTAGGASIQQTVLSGVITIPAGSSYVVTYNNIAGGPVAYELR